MRASRCCRSELTTKRQRAISDARQCPRFALRKSRRGVARAGQHSVQQPCSPAASSRRQSRRVALLRTEVCTENGSRETIYLCNMSFAVGRQAGKTRGSRLPAWRPEALEPARHAALHSKRTRLEKLLEKCTRDSRVEACHDSTLSHRRFAALLARDSLITCNRGPCALLRTSVLPRETIEQHQKAV